MPNMNELVDSVASPISGNTSDLIWFSNIDVKYAYSRMALSEAASRQGNFQLVAGNSSRKCIGSKPNFTGFYGLGDMPYEFQMVR